MTNESVVENSTVSPFIDLNGITLTESTNKEDKESKETVNKEQWRSPKVSKQVRRFFPVTKLTTSLK